jgi:hypothetical protein
MKYVRRPNHPQADEFGMIPAELAEPRQNWAVSVISDSMDAIRHHGTGEIIDSKSKFRAATRASGCIEVGTEKIKPRQPIKLDRGQRREAIRKVIYDLRNG